MRISTRSNTLRTARVVVASHRIADMAHALRFSLTMDGHPLAISLLDGSAIGFAGDVDVFARSTGLDLAIASEFDRQHFHQVLHGDPLTLVTDIDNGDLVYRCGSHERLPRGRYE